MTTANMHRNDILTSAKQLRGHLNQNESERRKFQSVFLSDVVSGLRASQKTLPCKYFYDSRGSELFDQICDLPEYYPTRTEVEILRRNLPEITNSLGRRVQVVEYGSGSGLKTRLLLEALDGPTGCALIEISRTHLAICAESMQAEFPYLKISAVCADYTRPVKLPEAPAGTSRKVVFFPGSTIGNFHPDEARSFLRAMAETVGSGGALLIGVDLQKDKTILEPAYDDAAGVTAEFNLNLLRRINRELGGNFQTGEFTHKAIYNAEAGRVEMHLESLRDQAVSIAGETFRFNAEETIHTENSYKYTLESFESLAASAGWNVEQVWTDGDNLFSVQYLTA